MATVDETDQSVEDELARKMGDDDDQAASGDVDEHQGGDVDEPELDAGDDDEPDDDDEEGDDELHPDEAAALQQADAAATLKKVSQTADRYIKRQLELLGGDLGGYQVCANCDGYPPGLVLPELFNDEHRNNVKRQLGLDTFDDLQTDETRFHACDVCGGRGRVRTGSSKRGQESVDCVPCHGHGFRRVGQETPAPAGAAAPGGGNVVDLLVPALEEGAPTDLPPFDNFGTPSWHEDYGKQPDFRTVPVSHWAGNLPASP